MSAEYRIDTEQGATWREGFVYARVTDPDTDPVTYEAVDLTNAVLRMSVKECPGSSCPTLLTLTSDGRGITVTDAAAGKFTVEITDDQTQLFSWRRALYDLKVQYASGDEQYIVYGKIRNRVTTMEEEDD